MTQTKSIDLRNVLRDETGRIATVESGDTGGTIFERAPDPAKTRRYYIAAESELWDFAPLGREELCGAALPVNVGRNRKSGKLR